MLESFIDIFLHLDTHLQTIISQYGMLTYLILFFVIFAETGLVVTPFLPGDSLLFAAGTFAALGSFDIALLFLLLTVAAIAGDTLNYWVGQTLGSKLLQKPSRFIKPEYIERTSHFYEKYGTKTIILARFIPIIRTFAPFVAGIGSMTYSKFITYNIVGGIIWVGLFLFSGYYFGNIGIVRDNFSLVILVIIFLSVVPAIIEYIRHKMKKRHQ